MGMRDGMGSLIDKVALDDRFQNLDVSGNSTWNVPAWKPLQSLPRYLTKSVVRRSLGWVRFGRVPHFSRTWRESWDFHIKGRLSRELAGRQPMFAFRSPHHQILNRIAGRLPVVQDCMHLFRDRH